MRCGVTFTCHSRTSIEAVRAASTAHVSLTMDLAVITNSFNRRDLLEKALPSLLAALRKLPLEAMVVIFDAGSTDGSREFVTNQASTSGDISIHLVTPDPPEASSFADGCNQAIGAALAMQPGLKWVFFYETDNLLPNHDALKTAVALLEAEPRLAGAGFTVEKINGQKAGYGCAFPGAAGFVLGQQLAARLHCDDMPLENWRTTPEGARWAPCDVVYTSPLLIRVAAWLDAGPMDARLFPFTDSDLDLCWNFQRKGWGMAVLDLPGVIHDNDSTPSAWSGKRVLWFHQSRYRLLRKHLGRWVVFLKPLLFTRHVLEWLLLAPRAARPGPARQSWHTRAMLIRKVFSGYQ